MVVNPICWFDSVVWGQVDSFGVVFLLLALRALWRDQPERAAIFTVIAAIIKPQLGHPRPARGGRDDPAGAVAGRTPADADGRVDGRRAGRRRDGHRRPAAGLGARGPDHRWRILTTGLAGFLTAVVAVPAVRAVGPRAVAAAPFFTSGLIDQIVVAGGGYPYLTVNAYNAWAVVPGDTGNSLASAGLWVCDAVRSRREPMRRGRRRCSAPSRRSSSGPSCWSATFVRSSCGSPRASPIA